MTLNPTKCKLNCPFLLIFICTKNSREFKMWDTEAVQNINRVWDRSETLQKFSIQAVLEGSVTHRHRLCLHGILSYSLLAVFQQRKGSHQLKHLLAQRGYIRSTKQSCCSNCISLAVSYKALIHWSSSQLEGASSSSRFFPSTLKGAHVKVSSTSRV